MTAVEARQLTESALSDLVRQNMILHKDMSGLYIYVQKIDRMM